MSLMGSIFVLIASLRNPLLYLSVAFGLPSVLLYLAQIATILRHKSFHNSFYSLFVIRATIDLVYVLNSYYGYRLPVLLSRWLLPGYSQLPNTVLVLYHFLSMYTFQADNLATVCVLLNRLTAIALPLSHEKLWTRLLWVCVSLIFVGPLFASIPVFRMTASIELLEDGDNGTAFIIYEQEQGTVLDYLRLWCTIFAVAFLAIALLLNVATFLFYKRRKNAVAPLQSQNVAQNGLERKLLWYSLFTFAGHILMALIMIALYICRANPEYAYLVKDLYALYPLLMDTGTVILASWLLLWASGSFRQQFLADIGWAGPKKTGVGAIEVKASQAILVKPITTTAMVNTARRF